MRFTMSGGVNLSPEAEVPEYVDMQATWEDGHVSGDAAFLLKVKALELTGERIGGCHATMFYHLSSPRSTLVIARLLFKDLVVTGDQVPPEEPSWFLRDQYGCCED